MDVDAMLEAMTPEQLFRYRVAYEVIPLDDGWKQTDVQCGGFHNHFTRFEHGQAGKTTVPADRWYKPGEYIPKVSFSKSDTPEVNTAALDLHQQMIEERYGDDWQPFGECDGGYE